MKHIPWKLIALAVAVLLLVLLVRAMLANPWSWLLGVFVVAGVISGFAGSNTTADTSSRSDDESLTWMPGEGRRWHSLQEHHAHDDHDRNPH